MNIPGNKIALGITEDHVTLGSHLIHFWRNQAEFERGVRFLDLGLAEESQHGVLFGHDEVIEGHGGCLWAEANVPHGAVFSFTLPVADGSRS